MRTIAVVLGDNDFGNTFRPLLESVHRAILWQGGMSRERAQALITTGLEFHYLAFQQRQTVNGDALGIQAEDYLRARLRVLFDEEAEADIQNSDHDHGAWYLEVPTGNVYSY